MFLNCAIVITRFGLKWQRIKDSSSGKRRDNVMHLYFRICMTFFVCAGVQEGYLRLIDKIKESKKMHLRVVF